jgi:hypothetical protein
MTETPSSVETEDPALVNVYDFRCVRLTAYCRDSPLLRMESCQPGGALGESVGGISMPSVLQEGEGVSSAETVHRLEVKALTPTAQESGAFGNLGVRGEVTGPHCVVRMRK